MTKRRAKTTVKTNDPLEGLRKALSKRTKVELIETLVALAGDDRRIFRQLEERFELEAPPQELAAATRQAIADANCSAMRRRGTGLLRTVCSAPTAERGDSLNAEGNSRFPQHVVRKDVALRHCEVGAATCAGRHETLLPFRRDALFRSFPRHPSPSFSPSRRHRIDACGSRSSNPCKP